jgi:hypothetical protein
MSEQMPCANKSEERRHYLTATDAPEISEESYGHALNEKWRSYRHHDALVPFIEQSGVFDGQEILEGLGQAFHAMAHGNIDDAAALRIGRQIIKTTVEYLKPMAEDRAAEIERENQE